MMRVTIPTVLDDLMALLERTPPTQWADVRRTLVEQVAEQADIDADRLFETAADTVMHFQNCEIERNGLRESLTQMGVLAGDARRHLAELSGPLSDVEYAETTDGRILAESLDTLARHIRAAYAINELIMRAYESKPAGGGAQ